MITSIIYNLTAPALGQAMIEAIKLNHHSQITQLAYKMDVEQLDVFLAESSDFFGGHLVITMSFNKHHDYMASPLDVESYD